MDLFIQFGPALFQLTAAIHLSLLELVGLFVKVLSLFLASAFLLLLPLTHLTIRLRTLTVCPVLVSLFLHGTKRGLNLLHLGPVTALEVLTRLVIYHAGETPSLQGPESLMSLLIELHAALFQFVASSHLRLLKLVASLVEMLSFLSTSPVLVAFPLLYQTLLLCCRVV